MYELPKEIQEYYYSEKIIVKDVEVKYDSIIVNFNDVWKQKGVFWNLVE
jgi:hypothetical protein